ncbi:hypothetical protein RHSIM_Rhsim03G0076000 [Rhododendron simsii]|uniref:BZIP domain-containing protein n=1 Tax=Rhododendron simsii TaxID=118357 RepID=A0A834H7R9_RHOSS|nr:hypothetical protein RHSIM_Rhsim03G0076000 [Rhododendron simsii]
MVLIESEIISKGEVGSPLQSDQQYKSPAFPSVGRQSSIYSLTLDEFQHSICESGKNFGSMNMDEFLNSIWTAEENQAQAQAQAQNPNPDAATNTDNNNLQAFTGEATSQDKGIVEHPSLTRQGSLTLPPPMCRKTVDEVWSEIHKGRQEQQQGGGGGGGGGNNNVQNSGSTQWQPTFGEMTLEDFLVKAGVVREPGNPPPSSQQQQQFGVYQNNNHHSGVGPSFVSRPTMGCGSGGGGGSHINVPTYQTSSQGRGGVSESSGYTGNGKRSGGYPPPPLAVDYGGRAGNVPGCGGGHGKVRGLGMGSPVSPGSSDGMCLNQADGSNQYGMDMGGMRGGQKRVLDGPVERVVERRQRRMIKNRESAARSRARKQAYTVELEAELNLLKDENAQLKLALAELERRRKQQYFDEAKMKAQTKAQRATEKLRVMRRTLSCPL